MNDHATRPGEVALPVDPATRHDATLAFIGRLRSPWSKGDCPHNLTEARERGGAFAVEIDTPYRDGLIGLAVGQPVILLYWMDRARRDLIVQAPRHSDTVRGCFSLRSPVRPNPVSLAITRITAIDLTQGRLTVEALDAYDGTPLIDIKPFIDRVDLPL